MKHSSLMHIRFISGGKKNPSETSSLPSNDSTSAKPDLKKKKKKPGTSPETVQFIRDLFMGILSFF